MDCMHTGMQRMETKYMATQRMVRIRKVKICKGLQSQLVPKRMAMRQRLLMVRQSVGQTGLLDERLHG